ncbi:cation-transporting P-type ATPase [Microbacterium sediminicola]|uniref:Cation-transporting P-type ATPase n=1 Tax=Microbacterium sediminicola TaxID=415210 RepID=A0ABP4TMN7_9MICO
MTDQTAAHSSAPPTGHETAWWTQSPDATVTALRTSATDGLSPEEAARRLAETGPNTIPAPPSPNAWTIAFRQFVEPMNLMLVAVVVVSLIIGQFAVAVIVAALIALNVVLGTRQELAARASVNALSNMQIPQVRVVRGGSLREVPAPEIVPGDLVQLEAGDLIPADGRLIRAATLQTQEAALTGESAPIDKDTAVIDQADVALGDRDNMLFQNTTVTRGTASLIVTGTGMQTQMGRIAAMLTSVAPSKSPLQRELDGLTKVLGFVAWGAVAIMIIMGLLRGETLATVLLVGIAMAVSAIPSALPTFVQGMLAYGAKQLAEHRAVVKNLSDVETLGATSAINSDKTGTLTLNQMTVTKLYALGHWYTVEGEGYRKSGALRHAAGTTVPDFTSLAYGLCLNSDATVSDSGVVVGDPTEAALVVLAAKLGVDAEESRRTYPRFAEVPFDSAYKFMVTFHHAPLQQEETFLATMKGGPDVVLDRCTSAVTDDGVVPIDEVREQILAANAELSGNGLRVLAFAVRALPGREADAEADPMALAEEFTFVSLVGIIDPLRPEAIEAVRVAGEAGIEVRMITGDHAVTAAAIGRELGLGPGAISGPELRALSDEQLTERLPDLHVFGRVTPDDKLRIARLMQQRGDVVAMTGDAVNDAAALKQADIGVAMGSGSEVTKQAGKMILTDDNFGTLVEAIRLGRTIYDKIVSYVRYQMATLFSLVLLFLVSSILDINSGVPITPLMVLFLSFFITFFPVLMITLDPSPAGLMQQKPRDTKVPLANARSVTQWLIYGVAIFGVALAAMLLSPGTPSQTEASVPVTMTFVVISLGSVFAGLAMRRDPGSGFVSPISNAFKWLWIPVVLTVCSVEIDFMQAMLMTTSLDAAQWWLALGLSVIPALVVELDKAIRRAVRRAKTA